MVDTAVVFVVVIGKGSAFISIFVDCIQFVLSNSIHGINGQQIKERKEEEEKNGNISIQASNTNCLACMRWDFHLCVQPLFVSLLPKYSIDIVCVCVCYHVFQIFFSISFCRCCCSLMQASNNIILNSNRFFLPIHTTKNIAPETKI